MNFGRTVCGEALEWAWKGLLGGTVSGGYGDGGVDLRTANGTPCQVKASLTGALEFLRVARDQGRWVADLLVGEPEKGMTREKVLEALERDGVWVSPRIPLREMIVAEASAVKTAIAEAAACRRAAQRVGAGKEAPLRSRVRSAVA